MDVIELLQQLGLTKYEAAAYRALLASGPLTGYELGKNSDVPLSRSYDTLERLLARGFVVVQPTTPPRYAAEDPARILARARAAHDATLETLTSALADLAQPRPEAEFWVLRGKRAILDRATALLAEATRGIALDAPADLPELASALDAARARAIRITAPMARHPSSAANLTLLIDDRLALVGTLAPTDHCQATISGNPALVATVRASFAAVAANRPTLRPLPGVTESSDDRLSWLAWEDRKLRRLIGGQ